MISIPNDILQQLVMHCKANSIAMAEIGSEQVTIILICRNSLSPDQASIIAAHMLLTGIMTGGFTNDIRQRTEEQVVSKENLN